MDSERMPKGLPMDFDMILKAISIDSERVFQDFLWILKGWPMDFLACAVHFERDCLVILIGLSIDSECTSISQAFLKVFQWILEGISINGV